MTKAIGHRRWAIADGFIPGRSTTGPRPELESHETLCFLNTADEDAHVEIRIYYADNDPAGPYRVTVPARRTLHLRMNDLNDPPLPRDREYAALIESDIPVVVQHTRLDSRQAELALFSTIAHPAG